MRIAKKHKLMNRDELTQHVAEEIAKNLPPEFIASAITDAISTCLTNFTVDAYLVNSVIKTAVLERAKELLRTTYATQINERATALAERALSQAR